MNAREAHHDGSRQTCRQSHKYTQSDDETEHKVSFFVSSCAGAFIQIASAYLQWSFGKGVRWWEYSVFARLPTGGESKQLIASFWSHKAHSKCFPLVPFCFNSLFITDYLSSHFVVAIKCACRSPVRKIYATSGKNGLVVFYFVTSTIPTLFDQSP